MATGRKKRKQVNVENALTARRRGVSYAQIARDQHVTPTAVYYALNPEKRMPGAAEGKQRSFYSSAELWDAVSEIAWSERVSVSSVVVDILTGRRVALELGAREERDGA